MKRYASQKKNLESFGIQYARNTRVAIPTKFCFPLRSDTRVTTIEVPSKLSILPQNIYHYQRGIRLYSTMTQTLDSESKSQPVVRIAKGKDTEAVAALGSKVFGDTFGYSMPAVDLHAYLTTAFDPLTIAKEAASPHIDLLVACDGDDHVMGFAQLTQGTKEPCIENDEEAIELQRLYVDQEYHGKGVARALFVEVENRARQMGYKTLWLGVWEENFNAQKVYHRFGFKKVGTHEFKMGECVQTDWIMSKSL